MKISGKKGERQIVIGHGFAVLRVINDRIVKCKLCEWQRHAVYVNERGETAYGYSLLMDHFNRKHRMELSKIEQFSEFGSLRQYKNPPEKWEMT